MSVPRKKDSDRIKSHISSLKQEPWLGPARSWWPDYLFRFEDIRSVANILNSGILLSRAQAKSQGVMGMDCASANVIARTADQWKQYVRLYFRPRTPMQYDTEGFRPEGHFPLDAHCPAPVVMLFSSMEVLTRADTRFSDGNLAAGPAVGDDARFLETIPFKDVYHDRWLEEHEKRSIVFHRHAEVIVPDKLDLSPLKYVVCRTQAEFETLLLLLEPGAREKWSKHIGPVAKANLHFRYWTFVEAVELSRERIRVKFNPSSKTPGPFHANMEITEGATRETYVWEKDTYQASNTLLVNIQNLPHPESYTVRIELDGNLAYLGRYQDDQEMLF